MVPAGWGSSDCSTVLVTVSSCCAATCAAAWLLPLHACGALPCAPMPLLLAPGSTLLLLLVSCVLAWTACCWCCACSITLLLAMRSARACTWRRAPNTAAGEAAAQAQATARAWRTLTSCASPRRLMSEYAGFSRSMFNRLRRDQEPETRICNFTLLGIFVERPSCSVQFCSSASRRPATCFSHHLQGRALPGSPWCSREDK